MLKPIVSEYYGDSTRWFVATVVSSAPPIGYEGRVKIRVHGIHSQSTFDIPESDLPWAQCVIPTTEGGVSGIGRMPHIQAGALVFGFFVDGINSQTPLVLGSVPHIELPTEVQVGQVNENIGEEKPEGFFARLVDIIVGRPDTEVDNDNLGSLFENTRRARIKVTTEFLLNLGLTLNQAIAVTACLLQASQMRTGEYPGGQGIASWSRNRYADLKAFTNDYNTFYGQLAFVAYELNGTERQALIKLLNTENIDGSDGAVEVVCRYYLRKKGRTFVQQSILQAKRLRDRIQ